MPDKDQLAPQEALDAMAVAPPPDPAAEKEGDPAQRAGQDPDVAGRVAEQPRSQDARLDEALDETMDASDPPSITQPRTHLPPLPPEDSSGNQRGS